MVISGQLLGESGQGWRQLGEIPCPQQPPAKRAPPSGRRNPVRGFAVCTRCAFGSGPGDIKPSRWRSGLRELCEYTPNQPSKCWSHSNIMAVRNTSKRHLDCRIPAIEPSSHETRPGSRRHLSHLWSWGRSGSTIGGHNGRRQLPPRPPPPPPAMPTGPPVALRVPLTGWPLSGSNVDIAR